jgi:hypothetical protein
MYIWQKSLFWETEMEFDGQNFIRLFSGVATRYSDIENSQLTWKLKKNDFGIFISNSRADSIMSK